MTRPEEIWFFCPHCGVPNHKAAVACSLCGQDFDAPPKPTRDEPSDLFEQPQYPPFFRHTFSIASILWAIALIAVGLGLVKAFGLKALVLYVLIAMATTRTIVVKKVRKLRGLPMDNDAIAICFLSSLALTVVMTFISGIAFLACCITVSIPTNKLSNSRGFTVGAVVAVVVAIFLCYLKISSIVRSKPLK